MSTLTPETQARLQSINKFLEDIYGHPRRLSDILRDAGLGEDEITQLRRDHLDTYLAGLLRRWQSWMAETLPSRRDEVIIRRYGLNGSSRPTLADPCTERSRSISDESCAELARRGRRLAEPQAERVAVPRLSIQSVQSVTSVVDG